MNFGRTVVVLFHILYLVLGGQGCDRSRRQKKVEIKVRDVPLG